MFKIADKDFTCNHVNQGKLDKQVEQVWGAMLLYTRQKWHSLEGNSNEVLQLREALKIALDNMNAHTYAYQGQLKKWLDSPDYCGDDKPKYNLARTAQQMGMQSREYNHWFEAALALDGWMQSAHCRKAEKKLAKDVYANPYLDTLLNSLVYKLHLKLIRTAQTHPDMHYPLTMELLSGQTIIRATKKQTLQSATVFGTYRIGLNNAENSTGDSSESSILPVKYQIPMEVLKAPQKYPLRDKIVLLHDMSDYLGVLQPWNPQTAGQWLIGTETAQDSHVTSCTIDGQMIREQSAVGENINANVAAVILGKGCNKDCRNETSASTLMARKQKLALWSGQSMTVVRMLNMARWANGSIPEFTALALGLMAFWRLDYAPNCNWAYHTLHETMDMAKNFGVKYYINSAKTGFNSLMMDNADGGLLTAYIDQLAAQIRSMLNDVDNRWQALYATPELDCDKETYNQWQHNIAQKRSATDELVNRINKLIRQDSWRRGHMMEGNYQPTYQPTTAQMSADKELQQSLQKLLDISYYIDKLQYSMLQSH